MEIKPPSGGFLLRGQNALHITLPVAKAMW